MAVIVQDLYYKLLGLLDQYTEDGVITAEEDVIDVQKKFIIFADQAQKELWKYNKITKQIEITNKPPKNRLGLLSNFDIIDFEGDTQYYPNEAGINNVQGYSIEVDGDCTITYEELVGSSWTQLVQLTPTGLTEMTTFKGILNVSSTTNPVRLVVSGTTHFKHMNRALWQFKYATDKVPEYAPWVKYDLPTDFNAVDMVVEEFPVRQYDANSIYKLENYRDFYYNFYFEGKIRVTYRPVPSTITALTDTIDIDDVLAEAIVYDCAAKIGFYENKDIVNFAEQRRIEAKTEASMDTPSSPEIMTDFYQGGGS